MTVQQLGVHQGMHMPSGGDALPWLGEYPYPGAGGGLGIHMGGLSAKQAPAPSSGTQSGSWCMPHSQYWFQLPV